MSEERLDRVEQGVHKLVEDLDAVKTDVAVLKTDVAVLKTDVAVLKADVAVLKADVAVLKADVAVLKADVMDIRRHMSVLHEEVVGRIKALGEDDTLRREMRAGFAEMRQLFLAHTVPGDAADRVFAATLGDHERRIQTLEQR
jgi:cell division protein FtsB